MTYREMTVAVAKIAGQELVDRAEELIPNTTEDLKDVDIWIRIPSMSGDSLPIPEIQVSANVYPKYTAVEKILKLISEV